MQQVFAVNEETGEMLQDVIMCHVLGVDKISEGYKVVFLNSNTLDCRRANLRLDPQLVCHMPVDLAFEEALSAGDCALREDMIVRCGLPATRFVTGCTSPEDGWTCDEHYTPLSC